MSLKIFSYRCLIMFGFLFIYSLTAGFSLGRHSLAPHFVYLAEAFLQGRLDLVHVPTPPYDLTPFEGRWYVSFPPLPALLMVPLVAVGGLAISDVAFGVVIGALAPAVFYILLGRLDRWDSEFKLWLSLLLGLGTPLWYCVAFGSVWYTAHVVAVLCLSLYALEVVGQNRPFLAGLWLGLGFLARAPVLFAFPLALLPGLKIHRSWRKAARFLLLFGLGLAPALVGQAGYNWARFGTPLEFGYRWMNSPTVLIQRQAAWGQFSLHFLPENLFTLLVRPPRVSLAPLQITPDPWGMGLLWTCPVLLLALRTLRNARYDSLRMGLWLSVLLVLLPSLFYFNTGSFQFGYRFALDWLPLGLMLVAMGMGGELDWRGKSLIVWSVLMHLWGVLWMYPNFNGHPWHLQYVELLRFIFQ